MAGVKGKSGGSRPNTGGARPGSGPKKKPDVLIPPLPGGSEPESLRQIRAIMVDVTLDVKIRLDAAKALAPFEAVRKGDVGKKGERQVAAEKAVAGKFSPAAAPRLVASGGKKV